jgi:hypothetical protein
MNTVPFPYGRCTAPSCEKPICLTCDIHLEECRHGKRISKQARALARAGAAGNKSARTLPRQTRDAVMP